MEERVAQLERELAHLKELYFKDNFTNEQTFRKKIIITEGLSLKDTTMETGQTGLIIGESTERVAFFGVTPIPRQGAISSPTGGTTIDSEARSAIDSIRNVLTLFGFTG